MDTAGQKFSAKTIWGRRAGSSAAGPRVHSSSPFGKALVLPHRYKDSAYRAKLKVKIKRIVLFWTCQQSIVRRPHYMEGPMAPCIRCEAGRRQQKTSLKRPGCALATAAARLWHSLHVHLVPQVSPGSWPSCQYQAPGVPVPCCDCRAILSASKTRAGQ